jgi:4-amino-4-deoxy-L-arabinose transferase-like glycosyltransferase
MLQFLEMYRDADRRAAAFAAVVTAAVAVAAIVWMIVNPLPSYWDEASYFNYMVHGARGVHQSGWTGFVRWVNFDPFRPPAMRVIALPLAIAAGPAVLPLRLLSFGAFLLSALLLGTTVRAVAGTPAGALAASMAVLSPVLVLALRMFGTEYPLLLALAMWLYFEFASRHKWRWIGAGVALGLGLLSKTSFIVVAVPMLIVISIVDRRRQRIGSVLLGLAIASTWWLRHFSDAMRFGAQSRLFTAHSLGPPMSLTTFVKWSATFIRCATGYGVALIALIVLADTVRRHARPSNFVLTTAAGALPLIIGIYFGTNHNPRLLAPALFLLLAAVAACAAPLLASRAGIVIAAALLIAQLLAITHFGSRTQSYIFRGASEVMTPVEQWDFTPVKHFIDARGVRFPRIAVMGLGYALNPPQVEVAWLRAGSSALPRAVWRDDWDLRRAVAFSATAQVAITAPGFAGDPSDGQPRINAHNVEYAQALIASGLFDGPFPIDVGVNEPARVAVFVRR